MIDWLIVTHITFKVYNIISKQNFFFLSSFHIFFLLTFFLTYLRRSILFHIIIFFFFFFISYFSNKNIIFRIFFFLKVCKSAGSWRKPTRCGGPTLSRCRRRGGRSWGRSGTSGGTASSSSSPTDPTRSNTNIHRVEPGKQYFYDESNIHNT